MNFRGTVSIQLRVTRAITAITLHAKGLLVSGANVTDATTNTPIPVISQTTDAERDLLRIGVSELLGEGRRYILDLEFYGDLSLEPYGIYVSAYPVGDDVR